MLARFALLCLLGAPPVAGPPAGDAALAKRLAELPRPKTIRARFTQVRTSAAFKAPQRATGHVLVGGPERLRWAYEAPYRMVLVRDGARVSMSYPDLGRKQAFDLDREPQLKAVFDTILFFHEASAERLAGRFDVEPGADANSYALVPRGGADKLIARIDVTLDPKRGVPVRVAIREPDGDASEITFTDVEIDQPVDEALLVP